MPLNPLFGSLNPSQIQQITSDNYLSFTDGTNDFAQQYLPEIYEAEVERYGNRTLGGFIRMVGAEMPMTSDQVVWSEQNRLHISYDTVQPLGAPGNVLDLFVAPTAGLANVITPGMTVVIMPKSGGDSIKAYVADSGIVTGSALNANEIQVFPYQETSAGGGQIPADAVGYKVFVYGSEYPKGSSGVLENVEPSFTQFSNKPVIIRDRYVVSGSDTAQIGWVEVTTEDGATGYLWYLKAESETRLRFEDYLEMVMVEGENAAVNGASANLFHTQAQAGITDFNAANAALLGTEGLFAAIQARGNVFSAFAGALADFDTILENLDSQGAIEENMLFLDRATELDIDNMLASQNSYGIGGTSYGVFENSEEMALNLQFSGFRRGSYDFYKTSWKYLNDASTRGGSSNFTTGDDIEGVLIPAGTSTVYDQILGTNIRRPFLHVRYRASQTDDRRMKSWITGSVGGAFTSDLDAMEVHFLSERCLCVQGANNFVLMTA
tara:strand:- start:16547 stop:18028 length:1482 start_codon:yes stop_codon:yes gene_type:complete